MIFLNYPKDCRRIQNLLFEKGYYATIPECQIIWENYSEHYCASWLILPYDNNVLWDYIEDYALKLLE